MASDNRTAPHHWQSRWQSTLLLVTRRVATAHRVLKSAFSRTLAELGPHPSAQLCLELAREPFGVRDGDLRLALRSHLSHHSLEVR